MDPSWEMAWSLDVNKNTSRKVQKNEVGPHTKLAFGVRGCDGGSLSVQVRQRGWFATFSTFLPMPELFLTDGGSLGRVAL